MAEGQRDLFAFVCAAMQGKVTLGDVQKAALRPSKSGAAEGRARRDRGHRKATARETPLLKAARATWADLCSRKRYLTSDDLWFNMPLEDASPDLGKVIGVVIRAAAGRGDIRKTGQYKHTARAAGHARIVAIWESRIVKLVEW